MARNSQIWVSSPNPILKWVVRAELDGHAGQTTCSRVALVDRITTNESRLWGERRGWVKALAGSGQIRRSHATQSGSRRGSRLREDACGSSASRTGSCASLHGSLVCLGSSRNLIWNWKKKISNWFQKLPCPSNFQKSLQLFPNHVRSNLIKKTSIFSLQH